MNNDPDVEMREYEELIDLQNRAFERGWSEMDGPFLIERFCADMAWMGKACPMYPPMAGDKEHVCKFLLNEGYENYRCPAIKDLDSIAEVIIERGTDEQKRALEHLADMSVRYSENPINEESASWVELTHYMALGEAIRVYEKLGLEEKTRKAKEVWDRVTTTKFTPEEIAELEMKSKIRNLELAEEEQNPDIIYNILKRKTDDFEDVNTKNLHFLSIRLKLRGLI